MAAYPAVLAGLASGGVDVHRAELVHPDDLAVEVARAISERCTLLVVGGGDGRIGVAAGLLAEVPADRRPVLGVLPLGTANDFARTLDLPAGLLPAVAVLTTGKVVDIDLGQANGLPFLNVASLGLSVGATHALRPVLKRRLGPLAYPLAALVAYRRHIPFSVRVEFPKGDHAPSSWPTCSRWGSATAGTTAAATRWRRTPGSTTRLSTCTRSRPGGHATT